MKQKAKRSFALLLALVMVFSFASVLGACGKDVHECGHVCEECGKCTSDCTDPVCKEKCPGHEKPAPHECKHVCPECGKCLDETCQDPVCADKCEGHAAPAPHECKHVCPECGKCLDETCQDPVCAEKCEGHTETPSKDGEFTPITAPKAGKYYMGMKCSGDVYYYLKGGMNGYYMATSTNKEDAVIVDLIADGSGWLLKQGNQYMEIENSNGHINAVFKATRTAGKNWAWDETYNIFTWENGQYFYGTYGSYNTIGGGSYATHAASNYKAQLGTFGDQEVVQPDPESVILSKTGKVYLAPQAGNYIQLNATVEPSAAAQDIVWASSNKQAATVENGKVTYVGAGETVISATAKDTTIKAEVTIVVTDKGSKEQPLSVDEAIALMDTAGDGVTLGDANNKFYITGKVEEGSLCDRTNGAEWTVNLLGADEKKLQCVFEHSNPVGQLAGPENGKLDNCTLVLQVSLKKDSSAYTVVEATFESGVRPAVASIKIDETAEVKMPIHAKLEVKEVLPANAQLDGTEQWHSSDESKATVDNKGEVTGVSAGEVQVWVSLGEVESNKCTVTITEQEKGNKIVFDWTSKLTDDTVVDNLYVTMPSKRKDHLKDYLGSWTPGQEEITAITFGDQCNLSSDCDGFGYVASAEAGTVNMTTAHEIKKVTFTIIPYSDAQSVEFTLNGKSVKETRQDTWNGKKASAITVTVDLDTATNTLAFEAPNNAGNKFFIVGMTLVW